MPTNIIRESIPQAMRRCYINYAMSVIKERALPDIRDGLKPVHRRILYSMYELGLSPEKPYMKCARTVGDVLGKFHPHGDTSVYDAMVNLAQDFSMRYPVVWGHGNFGSIDGDSAAAMRYTEARLTPIGVAMLENINKDTVDFKPNYDEKEKEPCVLPSMIPYLLANGTMGIAVGMASNIPPHNLSSLYDAIVYVIDKTIAQEEVLIDDLIAIVKAPDFPGGGIIMGTSGAAEAYRTGKGRVIVRSKYEIEEHNGKRSIIVTELPYKVNKARLIENMADLVKDKVIEGISDLRDESDKSGIRIVIELKRDANQEIVINKLLKHTKLQDSFSFNMITLVDEKPLQVNLKDILEHYLAHIAQVIMRRTQFELNKAEVRSNIVRGIIRCHDEEELLDRVINTMKNSDNPMHDLMNVLNFNEAQASHIYSMRLNVLLSKESLAKLRAENEMLNTDISKFNNILTDENVLLSLMKSEALEYKEKFGDERRTVIQNSEASFDEAAFIEEEILVVTLTTDGLIKSVEEKEYKTQGRGGKGVKAASSKEDESVRYMLTVNSKDDILFFTNIGKCHTLKSYKIAKASRTGRGKSINNYLNLGPDEHVISIISTNLDDEDKFLFFATRKGIVKKLSLNQLSTRHSSTKVISIKEGDELAQALVVCSESQVIMTTANGMSIRISMDAQDSKAVRPMGRDAAGVIGMNVDDEDYLVDMVEVTESSTLLTVTENGLGKRTAVSEFTIQGRGGKGLIAHKVTDKTGRVVSATTVVDNDELFIATEQGLITRIKADTVSVIGRNTSGVKLINLNEGDRVATISKGASIEEETEE